MVSKYHEIDTNLSIWMSGLHTNIGGYIYEYW